MVERARPFAYIRVWRGVFPRRTEEFPPKDMSRQVVADRGKGEEY